jgi:hypothetical protein
MAILDRQIGSRSLAAASFPDAALTAMKEISAISSLDFRYSRVRR